jgi:hypothetical protein
MIFNVALVPQPTPAHFSAATNASTFFGRNQRHIN